VTGQSQVACRQSLGNLWEGNGSHVGQPRLTSDSAPNRDARDACRDDDVHGSERITGAHLVQDGAERDDGSRSRLRDHNSAHEYHRIR